jgi:hypothetical protein
LHCPAKCVPASVGKPVTVILGFSDMMVLITEEKTTLKSLQEEVYTNE